MIAERIRGDRSGVELDREGSIMTDERTLCKDDVLGQLAAKLLPKPKRDEEE